MGTRSVRSAEDFSVGERGADGLRVLREPPTVMASAFERALRDRVGEGGLASVSLDELCEVCAEVTELRASIVLSSGGAVPVAVAASDGAAALEELQLTLGEGPSTDARADGRPVLVDELAIVG